MSGRPAAQASLPAAERGSKARAKRRSARSRNGFAEKAMDARPSRAA
jgi:hypothetical protein